MVMLGNHHLAQSKLRRSNRLQLVTLAASLFVVVWGSQRGSECSTLVQSNDDPMVIDRTKSGEIFYDAIDQEMQDSDDEFYDADDEIEFEEDAEENVCATASHQVCGACCDHFNFDNPFWNTTIGQCFCYDTRYEENICKLSASSLDCVGCCKRKHYKWFIYDNSGTAKSSCICGMANQDYYKQSFSGLVKVENN